MRSHPVVHGTAVGEAVVKGNKWENTFGFI